MSRQALRDKRRVLKDDHPSTTGAMNDLATLLAQIGKYEECEALHREALERRRRTLGEQDIDTLQSYYNLGSILMRREKFEEAEPFLRTSLEGRLKVLGDAHRYTVDSTISLAHSLANQGKLAEAEPYFATACEKEALATRTPEKQGDVMAAYGSCLAKLDKLDRAEPVLLEARRLLLAAQVQRGPAMESTLAALHYVFTKTNRPEEAAKFAAEHAAIMPATQPATQTTTQPAP
jgi:tetratricopeptide (TPR) repeat protein